MKPKVFIDGSEGTTGLQIHSRLADRTDIELLRIDPALRKDTAERKRLINSADLVFICLPDDAARGAVSLIKEPGTRVIDASTAHRTAEGWVYGLPELSKGQKACISTADKVSNPGCHATGAILLLAPLIKAGLAAPDGFLSITSLTGYTGGGKSMIEDYEKTERAQTPELDATRLYSVTARHKHIAEIMRYAGLDTEPAFMPVLGSFPQGMQVIVPFHLPGRRQEVFDVLAGHYAMCGNIEVSDTGPPFAASNILAGSDRVFLKVLGHGDIIILTAQYDNLGKGAAGAAVQNMNIMLGLHEFEGVRM